MRVEPIRGAPLVAEAFVRSDRGQLTNAIAGTFVQWRNSPSERRRDSTRTEAWRLLIPARGVLSTFSRPAMHPLLVIAQRGGKPADIADIRGQDRLT